jgi:predicted RNA-binding protein
MNTPFVAEDTVVFWEMKREKVVVRDVLRLANQGAKALGGYTTDPP